MSKHRPGPAVRPGTRKGPFRVPEQVEGPPEERLPSAPQRTAARHLGAIAILVVLTAGLYAAGLSNPFVMDDPEFIFQEASIRSPADLGRFFSPAYWREHRKGRSYRPIVQASISLNRVITGDRPAGLRAVNVALLAGAAALVYWLVWRLAGSRSAALIAGLVFAVHPMHLETVTMVKNRAELLAGVFGLLALLWFLRAAAGGGRWWLWWVASMVATAAALISKEVALAVPLVLSAAALLLVPKGRRWDRFPDWTHRRFKPAARSRSPFEPGTRAAASRRRGLALTAPMWLLAVALVVMLFTAMPEKYARPRIGNWQRLLEFAALGPTARGLVTVKTVGTYLGLLVWPFSPCADRAFEIPRTLWRADVLVSLGGMLVVAGLVVWTWRRRWDRLAGDTKRTFSCPRTDRVPEGARAPASRRRLAAFALIWLVVSLGPVANLVPVASRPIAEQRLFGATIPLSMLAGLALARLGALWFVGARGREKDLLVSPKTHALSRIPATAFLIGLLAAMGAVTVTTLFTWGPELRFWERTARQSPEVRRALYNYADELRWHKRLPESVEYLERAVRLDDVVPQGIASLASSMRGLRRYEDAKRLLRLSLSWAPDNAQVHGDLAMVLLDEDQPDAGLYELREVTRLEPENPAGHFKLGQTLVQAGRFAEAVGPLRRAVALAPDQAGCHFALAQALAGVGRLDEAIVSLRRARDLAPNTPIFRLALAEALHNAGRSREALAECQRVSERWAGQPPAREAAGLAERIRRQISGR